MSFNLLMEFMHKFRSGKNLQEFLIIAVIFLLLTLFFLKGWLQVYHLSEDNMKIKLLVLGDGRSERVCSPTSKQVCLCCELESAHQIEKRDPDNSLIYLCRISLYKNFSSITYSKDNVLLRETKLGYVNNESVLRACFAQSPLDYES